MKIIVSRELLNRQRPRPLLSALPLFFGGSAIERGPTRSWRWMASRRDATRLSAEDAVALVMCATDDTHELQVFEHDENVPFYYGQDDPRW